MHKIVRGDARKVYRRDASRLGMRYSQSWGKQVNSAIVSFEWNQRPSRAENASADIPEGESNKAKQV